MSDVATPTRVRFDPTINVGHLFIAGVFALSSTSSVMVAYASLRQADALLGQRIANLEELAATTSDQGGRIIRLETYLQTISDTIDRVEAKLDRIEEGLP